MKQQMKRILLGDLGLLIAFSLALTAFLAMILALVVPLLPADMKTLVFGAAFFALLLYLVTAASAGRQLYKDRDTLYSEELANR